MSSDWYQVVEGSALVQGDLILACPVPKVETVSFPLPDELEIVSGEFNLVVLTQSCDLANDKVEEVLFAGVRAYRQMVADEREGNPAVAGTKWRKALVRGDLPAYLVLPRSANPPLLDWSVVDFHHLFTLPKAYTEAFAANVGARLRLVPPYREHLVQAFARYVMRVGLPQSLSDFETLSP